MLRDLRGFPEPCTELLQQQAQQTKAQCHSKEEQSSGSACRPCAGASSSGCPGHTSRIPPGLQGTHSSFRASCDKHICVGADLLAVSHMGQLLLSCAFQGLKGDSESTIQGNPKVQRATIPP